MEITLGQQYNVGEKSTAILYTYINRHAGTPEKAVKTKQRQCSTPVQIGQSFKTVGNGCTSCWGDVGAGDAEADVIYIPFIVSVQYIGY